VADFFSSRIGAKPGLLGVSSSLGQAIHDAMPLRAMMANRRLANPEKFEHLRDKVARQSRQRTKRGAV
jgi:hypothetical protein